MLHESCCVVFKRGRSGTPRVPMLTIEVHRCASFEEAGVLVRRFQADARRAAFEMIVSAWFIPGTDDDINMPDPTGLVLKLAMEQGPFADGEFMLEVSDPFSGRLSAGQSVL